MLMALATFRVARIKGESRCPFRVVLSQFARHPVTVAADELSAKAETGCDVDPSVWHPPR